MSRLSVEEQGGLSIIQPADKVDLENLGPFLSKHREEIRNLLGQKGAILLRGFPIYETNDFFNLITDLNFNPWYPPSWNPPFYRLLKHFKSLPLLWTNHVFHYFNDTVVGSSNPRQNFGPYVVRLPPAKTSIQPPHVEYGNHRERPSYIALHCQQTTPETNVETALFNLNSTFEQLSETAQSKYATAWSEFNFKTESVNGFLRLMTRFLYRTLSSSIITNSDKSMNLIYERCPLVLSHPQKHVPCIQPFIFAKNVHMAFHEAAIECFPDREVLFDEEKTSVEDIWSLYSDEGERIDWSDDEKKEFFKILLRTGIFLQWEPQDVLIFDNIYYGHARMEGTPSSKRIMNQISLNAYDSNKYKYRGARSSDALIDE